MQKVGLRQATMVICKVDKLRVQYWENILVQNM